MTKKKRNTINLDICTPKAKEAIEASAEYAEKERLEFITPEVLLYTIIKQKEFKSFGKSINLDLTNIEYELIEYNQGQDRIPEEIEYPQMISIQMEKLITKVFPKATKKNHPFDMVTVIDLIEGMYFMEDSVACYILHKFLGDEPRDFLEQLQGAYADDTSEFLQQNVAGIQAEAYVNGKKVESVSSEEILRKMMASASRLVGAIHNIKDQNGEGIQIDFEALPHSQNQNTQREQWEEMVTLLNDTYKKKNPLVGREKELQRAIRILCRKDKNNPVFIGEPGVGKTALVYGLAKMIDEGNVPDTLKNKRIYALDMASIVAGASYHGEFERRMKTILDGAKNKGNCIIYIDEIHTLAESGSQGQSISGSELVKPYLEDGSLRFIGSTTYQEYNKHIASKKALARRFGTIDVKEPTPDEALEIVQALVPVYEKHHKVKYSPEAIEYTVMQSHALIHDRFLPDKAIDIIDEAGAFRQQNPLLDRNGNPKAKRYQKVDTELIDKVLTDVCRIDAKALTSKDNEGLKNLDERISKNIYGQDEAIRQVVRSVMLAKAGLSDPEKPLASLMFVGPTGVGKTEVCKVLAQELGIELIRFDMSEYTEKHTISKLIGSPAGYIGYDEGGLLTDAIRKTPNCVLLLDEIEKAHTDIFNILLQVMDYAKLTDNKGNKADFKNVILVMTSNAGAQFAGQASIGFGGGQSKGDAMLQTVKKTFKPEFINRLSGIVVFNEMDEKMASLILDKKLRMLAERLKKQNVNIDVDDDARKFLLKKGFTTQYGAREMDRAINQQLTPILMDEILFGNLKNGGSAVVTCTDETLKLNKV